MRRFAAAYEAEEVVQQVVAQLPWGHHTVLLDRVSSPAEREWYAGQIIEHGWSRTVLRHHIGTNLFARQGQAVTNFEHTLVPPQSDLAAEMLKDPYHLEFLDIEASARERDLERSLLTHLRDFFLELGVGFALVGSQYALEIGGQDYRIDLPFYHLRLRCFVVVELKVGPFQPEHAGKMNFYLCALDEHLCPSVPRLREPSRKGMRGTCEPGWLRQMINTTDCSSGRPTAAPALPRGGSPVIGKAAKRACTREEPGAGEAADPLDAFTNPRAHPSLSFAVPRDPVLPGAPGRLLIVHGQTQRRIPLVPYSPSRFQ
jgi:predicted nuclease of restriction endonuclease-like (RecB) superfamily